VADANLRELHGDALAAFLRDEERLVLLAFLDAGCEPCRELRPQLARLAAEQSGTCAVVTVDAARAPADVERHGVRVFPTLVFLKQGVELHRLRGGALPPSTLALLAGADASGGGGLERRDGR
jgi:thioredoxin-like negative regulator of GroEL